MKNNPLIKPEDRIYYIDFLRALAILLVLIGHTVSAFGAPNYLAPLQFGGSGVDLFFLLSGWLIGSQLFKEYQRYGNIQIKRFWIRRWLRTLPAYYAVLFATLTQQYLTKDAVTSPIPHLLFFQNYTDMNYFTVSWSLALEEQFYLAIAPIILFLHRLPKLLQTSVLLLILVLPSAFRHLGWYESSNETHVRWDCCVMGVLLANIYYQYRKFWDSMKPFSLIIAVVCLLVYISIYISRWMPEYLFITQPSYLFLALLFGGMVIFAVNTPVSKLPFAHNIIMHISTRSYAMYLLHVEALAVTKRLIPDSYFMVFLALTLIITLLLSEILFRYAEQPILRSRDKWYFSRSRSKIPV